jgi:hypothetical protein
VDHRRIQEGPAQRIKGLQPGPGTAMGQMHRPHPGETQRINRTAADPGQLIRRKLPVLHRLGLDPGALAARPLVAVNQKDGGNHGASKRRTPEGSVPPIKGSPPHRSAHQRRTPKDGEPGPDPWRGADHGGACGWGADQDHSESDGSEDPERIRPALHLELHRPLLGRGNRHQAARAHGMGSGIKEPDPCPARIKTGTWCWMPTELMEEWVGMAAFAEDSQTRPQPGATQGRLWNRPITTTE